MYSIYFYINKCNIYKTSLIECILKREVLNQEAIIIDKLIVINIKGDV